jgi:hypothetical protein
MYEYNTYLETGRIATIHHCNKKNSFENAKRYEGRNGMNWK